MNELLARLRDVYVAPAAPAAAIRRRAVAPAPAVAVLGAPRQAAVVAAGVALAVARTGGWPCALVGFWRAEEGRDWRMPAVRGARRLAARLEAHGLEASASGRLARLWLPDDAAPAVAAAERATCAARVPVALALAGAREAEIDDLLRVQDVVVLARRRSDDPALGDLALDSLAGLAATVVMCEVGGGAITRGLALAGAAVPGGPRGALRPAVEAVV